MSGSGIGYNIPAFPYGGIRTLADILLKLAQNLKGLRYSTATGDGSSTTLVDAYMDEPDDYFNGGTIFFLNGVLAGKTAVITDWDEDTHTFTFRDASEAPLTDTQYAVFDANYKRDAMVAAINQALSELGPYPTITEDVTFVTVANQEAYELPTGVTDVRRVYVATSTTTPYNYAENVGWHVNGGVLYLDMNTPSTTGFIIKLFHEEPHDYVSDDDDPIMDCIHPDLLAWTAAVHALITRTGVAENSEPHTKEMLQFAQAMAQRMRGIHPIKHWQKASRPSGW
jgi:hypothetical protein